MAVEDYSTQLERVQAAIAAVEERGSAISAEGRSLSRADLATLYERETYLRRMVNRASTGGIRMRGATPTDG